MANDVTNWTIDTLSNIHKPIQLAKFKYVLNNELELSLSGEGEDSQQEHRKGVTVRFDGPKQNFPNNSSIVNMDQWGTNERQVLYDDDDDDHIENTENLSDEEDFPLQIKDGPNQLSDEEEEELTPAQHHHGGATNNILVDHWPSGALNEATHSTPNQETNLRKQFWDRNTPKKYTIGFNATKIVKPFIPNAPISKTGQPFTHYKDKVQCQICGGIYTRSNGTQHRKSQKHIKAFNISQNVVQILLTTRKRKYYFDIKTDSGK